MIYGSVSRRYAKALFDTAAAAQALPAVVGGIEAFRDLWAGGGELRQALTNPMVPLAVKTGILEKVAGRAALHDTVRRFLHLLLRKGRMEIVPIVALQVRAMADDREGILRGEVASAAPLDPATADALVRALQASTGKKVVIAQRVDPALIGGAVIRIGDKIIDGSLRSALSGLRRRLTGVANP